jgi:hypothetical protein
LVCFGAGFGTVTFSTPLASLGRDVLDLDAGWEFDRTRERAVAALDEVIILVLLLALILLLATDGEEIVGHVELDILLLQPGSSAVISITLSVSLISMLGIVVVAKPGILRVTPSNSRSISCCRRENGLVSRRVMARWVPTGITDFVFMCASWLKPYWRLHARRV